MIGLLDCNNFFVSCERIFRPELKNCPIVVLSNNDGCVVSLSEEAKKMGITRGVPFYQIKDLIEQKNIAVFSGNHRLYGDISSRVMATISSIMPNIEIASIDEAFIDFDGISFSDIEHIGKTIVKKVRRDIGVPVSLGIAPTKTLAKVGAYFAKRYKGYSGVCIIDNRIKVEKALSLIDIRHVWGIGRKLVPQLNEIGIYKAIDFARLPLSVIKQKCNITGEKTWRELNGEPCIANDSPGTDNKQMCSSRSFAHEIYDIESLTETIAAFSSSLSHRLRSQKQYAISMSVFIHTNAYNTNASQYYNSAHITFDEPTNDTLTITEKAISLLKCIYKDGYGYKKAGVIITEIAHSGGIQLSLFESSHIRDKKNKLMDAVDKINSSASTSDLLHLASHRHISSFMRQEHISHQYTTNINDIITIKCNIDESDYCPTQG